MNPKEDLTLMRYCGHFLIKAEGGAKDYKRELPLLLAWQSFTVSFVLRKGYIGHPISISDVRYTIPNWARVKARARARARARDRAKAGISDVGYRYRTSDIHIGRPI